VSPPEPARPDPRRLYFVGPATDFALVGGVSIVLFVVLKLADYTDRTYPVWTLAAWLSWIVNWPHFSSTSYRLYHSKENIRQYPITALVVPVLILAAMLASFLRPDTVAPSFIKLFLIWSPYHFCAQSLGICLLYARRAGYTPGTLERLALSGFTLGIYLTSQARSEAGVGVHRYFDVSVPTLGLPLWVPRACEAAMWFCGAAFLVFVAAWSIRNRRLLPPIVLLPALTQYVWFLPGNSVASFNEFVPFFHSLQYLLLAWSVQMKERLHATGASPSGSFVGRESLTWGLLNFVGGALLFWGFPRLAELLGFSTAHGYPALFAEGIVITAVQLHHFFVDGVIWKIRNPKVAAPLLVNVRDLVGEPARSPA
jgi:hypothetical protein